VSIAVLLAAWIGHAYVWTAALNHTYGRPIPKWFLRPFRVLVGLMVFAVPIAAAVCLSWDDAYFWPLAPFAILGGVIYPAINVARLLRPRPPAVLAERTRSLDPGRDLGRAAVGEGHMPWATRLPFTCAVKLDLTDVELKLDRLPPEWDGLTVLLLSDFHFHGTPSKLWFEHVIARVQDWPMPDVVCLAGDFLDSVRHSDWIPDLLGRLEWTELGVAVLGNHDVTRTPAATRAALAKLGYRVLNNIAAPATIRGVPCCIVGHEGPWFEGTPNLDDFDRNLFKLCVSHSPDNFPWAVARGIDLVLCGHVHGGQVRLPFIGSMFVPSIYGRAYDQGVFQSGGTVMAVSRGLSGKEPLRFRCHPQVLRLTLRAA
jgi:uncharacterized protein